jgi:chemotaxis protein CheY-P-specific phosphatase CheC
MTDNSSNINKAFQLIAQLSIDKASQVLSKMIKVGAKIELQNVFMSDITAATEDVMEKDNCEVVGALVDLIGDAPFKFLFYVDQADSLVLTDLILRKEIGTSKEYNLYTQSAIQELGNVISNAVANVFSTDFDIALRPAPPTVLHDFAGIIFQEYLIASVGERNEVLIIESLFRVISQDIKCRMFLLPTSDSDQFLSHLVSSI